MALRKVNDRVELRSGKTGVIRAIRAHGPLEHQIDYQVALEPGQQPMPLWVKGIDVIKVLPPVAGLNPHLARVVTGTGPFAAWPAMNAALHDISSIFGADGIQWAIQGSAAAVLHGAVVTEMPGDFDVLVDNLQKARGALAKPGFPGLRTGPTLFVEQSGSWGAVWKYRHRNLTDVDVVKADEFGMNLSLRTSVAGIWVLTLAESLIGILLRLKREVRKKDAEAFASLVALKGGTLSSAEKLKIVPIAKNALEPIIRSNPEHKNFRIDTWVDVETCANLTATSLHLGL